MKSITLKELKKSDIKFFAKWWRNKDLLKLTSGRLRRISDEEVKKYFQKMIDGEGDRHFMIILNKKPIGHIFLAKRGKRWHETHIVIGEKKYWNKGYGAEAIKLLIDKAKKMRISKIYLEVRPNNLRAVRVYEKCGFIKAGFKKYPKNKYLPITLKMILKQ
jgi:RimJ/RimL family protein N-acetyltransferase